MSLKLIECLKICRDREDEKENGRRNSCSADGESGNVRGG